MLLLESEDGAEGSREENVLNCGESNEAFTEGVGGCVAPMKIPVHLVRNIGGGGVNGLLKETCIFGHSWDQCLSAHFPIGSGLPLSVQAVTM